jgi:hypothetical protein
LLASAHPEKDYAFARPSLVRQKVRLLELAAGDARRIGYRNPVRVFATPAQHRLEREVGTQAERAYRRFVKDFQATGKKGAGAITGARISVPARGKHRGRNKPRILLFRSRQPAPTPHREREEPGCPGGLDLHP